MPLPLAKWNLLWPGASRTGLSLLPLFPTLVFNKAGVPGSRGGTVSVVLSLPQWQEDSKRSLLRMGSCPCPRGTESYSFPFSYSTCASGATRFATLPCCLRLLYHRGEDSGCGFLPIQVVCGCSLPPVGCLLFWLSGLCIPQAVLWETSVGLNPCLNLPHGAMEVLGE